MCLDILLSLPTSEGGLSASQIGTLHDFNAQAQLMASHQFHIANPCTLQHQQSFQQHPTFTPHQFAYQPSGLEVVEQPVDDPPVGQSGHDVEMREHYSVPTFPSQAFDGSMRPSPMQQPLEKFRYRVTLNAPTAMIKHADEIPVTYLNKGQAYLMNIVDTAPQAAMAGRVKYRTFVRISFEDEQQRQRPRACWQLWKVGRGTAEAHKRGGKLQPVEYVGPGEINGSDDPSLPRIELESASFDGLSVTWTPLEGSAECSVAVRFNFLSTDFSRSKGVKGIAVRLCAKTELMDSPAAVSPERIDPEICFCKVKSFRDHGAERKLSNDVAHVKKTIDKLKQQIAEAETGVKDLGKRKRSGSAYKVCASSKLGKVLKHKGTWSMPSASSNGGRATAEESLYTKLATLHDMYISARQTSVLHLRGDEQDDPDLHPVCLSGEPQELTKTAAEDHSVWDRQSDHTTSSSSILSPPRSNHSVKSEGRRNPSSRPAPFFNGPPRMGSDECRRLPQKATGHYRSSNPQHPANPPDQPAKVQSFSPNVGTLTGWIEALGVDYSYQQPPERIVKPVACFYVKARISGNVPEDSYYRAVYLIQRTLTDLVNCIAKKCNIRPTQVKRTVRITRERLSVLFDDESVRELPEEQYLTIEFCELETHAPVKYEWGAGPSNVQADGDIGVIGNLSSAGYELKLFF
ncbi:hypothetical protein LTR50_007509 [Elasticomyces elasticus]|nr:hypothetical protein LTR50_007509 [Elasticomyces elasticus]